jgi:hypothetical protein
MAVVPGVLLDQVTHDPPQAGGPAIGPDAAGQPVQASVGQRLRTRDRERATASCQSPWSCSGASPAAERRSQSGIGLPVHLVPWRLRVSLV